MKLTVIELAKKSDVAPHVVRYYARTGLLHPTCGSKNGYRLFTEDDIARVRFIRQAQRLGFKLKEIAQIFAESRHKKSPCPTVRQIIGRRVKENKDELNKLERLQARMKKALVQWKKMPDGMPDGNSVCHLIESVVEAENSA